MTFIIYFRANIPLSDKELRKILEDPQFFSDEEPLAPDNSDDDDSEEETEVIEFHDHQSDSEQEIDEDDEEGLDVESSTEYFLGKGTKWYKKEFRRTKTKKKNIVKRFPVPKLQARNIDDELDAFHQIIDVSMIDEIVKCTNIYIEYMKQFIEYTRDRDVKETTPTEIMALFGLLYLLGLKKLNHTNVLEIWTTDGTGMEIVRAVMSYKRFLFLLRCLRFDDKSTRVERRKYDKLAPIRSILDLFITNCKSAYSLGEFITIDEKLQAFRGRCSFVQYIPNKPAKYGIKIFALCDARTFYTGNLEVYCGKQPEGQYRQSNSPTDIVNRLIRHLEGSSRNLTTDNWYTSYPLALSLLERKITILGTMRKNKREIPVEFLPHRKRAVNSALYGFQKEATLVSFVPKKNKAVILLSTMHDSGVTDEATQKPEIILDYNATKGAVDTVDQMCGSYSVARKTRRWPLVIFYALLDITGINAQILFYSNQSNRKEPRRIFLKNLAFSLMKPHLKERSKILSLPKDITLFLSKYRSEETEGNEEPATKKRGRCVTCGRAKNVNTTITCDKCHNHVCKKHVLKTQLCVKCREAHTDSD